MKKIYIHPFLAVIFLSGCAVTQPLSTDSLSISPQAVTEKKFPISVGLFIEEETRNFKKTVHTDGQVCDSTYPVGSELSKILLRASQTCFERIKVVTSLPNSPSKDVDVYLLIQNLQADIQTEFTQNPRAAFPLGVLIDPPHTKVNADLSISVRVIDPNSGNIYSFPVSGKGASDTSFNFAAGVNTALQDLAKNFIQKILNSDQIRDFSDRTQNVNAALAAFSPKKERVIKTSGTES